ncbi:hypothetical protein Lesp02_34890 [Lentzea sp. NBRC 105346]|nr:hypothetical protein Lesp02_34890 [Lentzea sp. NBRC 105346]
MHRSFGEQVHDSRAHLPAPLPAPAATFSKTVPVAVTRAESSAEPAATAEPFATAEAAFVVTVPVHVFV